MPLRIYVSSVISTTTTCIGQELHETANRRRCTGTHYVDAMMLLVKTAEVAGLDRAIVGLEKKVVLDMFSKSQEEFGEMTNDRAIYSKCWM